MRLRPHFGRGAIANQLARSNGSIYDEHPVPRSESTSRSQVLRRHGHRRGLSVVVLQAFLHKYGRWSELVDLPLLVTIYFGVSRRNPVTGLLLGAAIGILRTRSATTIPSACTESRRQSSVTWRPRWARGSIPSIPPAVSRSSSCCFIFIRSIYAFTERVLLDQPAPFFTLRLLLASIISAAVAVVLFALLDRLRRSS